MQHTNRSRIVYLLPVLFLRLRLKARHQARPIRSAERLEDCRLSLIHLLRVPNRSRIGRYPIASLLGSREEFE